MRGDFGETNAWQMTMGQASQPVLERCGVVCFRVDTAADVSETVAAGLQMAYRGSQAIAILLSQRLIGAKTFR
jgi:sulfopyruvate decarboxylase TPP-binding subunit